MQLNPTPDIPQRWTKLIEGFKSFGGVASNIVQRKGRHGLGLFPIDPNQIVKLHIPKSLLVSTNNLELREGKVVIKDKSVHPEGFADWYEKFQADFSWGAEAQPNIQNFESELQNLPNNVLNHLQALGLINQKVRFSSKENLENIFERFILSRQIFWNDKCVLMPIIELVNHSPAESGFIVNDQGISIGGKYSDEVLVRYSNCDPLRRFIQYGFVCKERLGFSLNVNVVHNGKKIAVKGGINKEPLKPASINVEQNIITINQPLLGSFDNPKYPKMLFQKTVEQVCGINSDELFEQIYRSNRLELISIIKKTVNIKGDFIIDFQESCFQQLEAISAHIGRKSGI